MLQQAMPVAALGGSVVDQNDAGLETALSLSGMLGYLNFSGGKPEPRFQKQISDAYAFLASRGVQEPWVVLFQRLTRKLETLHDEQASAFRDIGQARAVLHLAFSRCLPTYRQHHAD